MAPTHQPRLQWYDCMKLRSPSGLDFIVTSMDPKASSGRKSARLYALRYLISAREYRSLHERLSKNLPLPSPSKFEATLEGKDDFNAAAIRASLRVFIAAQAGLKSYDLLLKALTRKPREPAKGISPNTRLAVSLSGLLFINRILHRFFVRMRTNLLTQDAAPFRRRNPRVSRALTARLTPAIGASALAGVALGLYPADQFRLTVAIYLASRAGEFLYNALEDDGWFQGKPSWVGSWMFVPPASGQLLHAFVFDRECFPAPLGNFILRFSNTYVQSRPAHLPESVKWPDVYQVVDALAEMSRLRFPPYVSPILFPDADPLPANLEPIAPVIAVAHPAITSLTCAVTHPSDPSCLRTFIHYWLNAFPRVVRVFAVIFGALSALRYKKIAAAPISSLNSLAKRILKMSLFVTGGVGMGWSTICLYQSFLPRKVAPTGRWFWGGFLGGMWALLIRNEGRDQFLYVLRTSMDSLYKVGKKKNWWRGVKNGDLLVICASVACISAVYEHNPEALRSDSLAKGIGFLRGTKEQAEEKKQDK